MSDASDVTRTLLEIYASKRANQPGVPVAEVNLQRQTKNKWLIFILIATGSIPSEILPAKNNDGKPIVQYSFEATDKAREVRDLYTRGLPIPVPDARVFEDIERNFKIT